MQLGLKLPKWSDVERFLKDPELLTAEILFLTLTLSNVFVIYRLLLDIIPYPVFVTWWQLTQGLFMAWVLGDLGKEFPKLSYFPAVNVTRNLLRELIMPTFIYCTMLVLANVLLSKTSNPAIFPVVVCFTVVLHHLARFVGCGEEYMGLRWKSMLILFIAFVLGCTDSRIISIRLLPWALAYAAAAALFRAGYLQKVMHTVEGRGNALHNHQHTIGAILLPLIWIPLGEWKALTSMPYNFSNLYTWQMWGCLVTVGALPFIKNIVSNRLIRRTGQAPWRFLEIVSIILVFLIGISFGMPSWQGWLASCLVVMGRSVGALDAIKNAQEVSQEMLNVSKPTRMVAPHEEPSLSPDTALLGSYEGEVVNFSSSSADE